MSVKRVEQPDKLNRVYRSFMLKQIVLSKIFHKCANKNASQASCDNLFIGGTVYCLTPRLTSYVEHSDFAIETIRYCIDRHGRTPVNFFSKISRRFSKGQKGIV